MKGYKHLTEAERQRVIDLYREHGHAKMVQELTGYSVWKVAGTLKRAGFELEGGRVSVCRRQRELLEKLCGEGRPLTEIAQQLGTNRTTVKRFVAKFGIPYEPFQQSGENNPSWKGGRMIDKAGYVLLWKPQHPHADRHGYVREHRLVMEQKLGRFLLPTEVVHHKDDDPSNNDPDNLVLFDSNGDHLRETLKGKCPDWSPEGFERIRQGKRLDKEKRASANRKGSGTCDPS